MTLHEQLRQRYSEILKKIEYQTLILEIANDHKNGKGKGFSDILLGFVPDGYETAEHKILVVGRETRGWRLDDNFAIVQYSDGIIEKSMQKVNLGLMRI